MYFYLHIQLQCYVELIALNDNQLASCMQLPIKMTEVVACGCSDVFVGCMAVGLAAHNKNCTALGLLAEKVVGIIATIGSKLIKD